MATKAFSTTYDPRQTEKARYGVWKAAGYFRVLPDPARPKHWAVMMPLPNVTGELHIGHALNNGLQDVLTRFHRMRGYNALYQPGTDHAGIATQNVVERALAAEGIRREDLGREKFQDRVWAWVRKYGDIIYTQLERLGISCDWDRKVFTLDPGYYHAVMEAFVRLYRRGLIYRGQYMVNWCPHDQSVISDLEVEHEPVDSHLWHVRYRGVDGSPGVVIATQRPETIPADVAVAVHPDDDRYRGLVGSQVIVPIVERRVPMIADRRVDPQFGTGALKITPGHDLLDNEIGKDHALPVLVVLDPRGRMTPDTGKYAGMDRVDARAAIAADLQAQGLMERIEPYRTSVGHCDRCHTVIEPYISDQWFCEMKDLSRRAAEAIRAGRVRFHPERWRRVALDWLDNIRPWPISRQLWWGHRIPVWQCEACGERTAAEALPAACPSCGGSRLTQDPDVLDTWFSSALWPFATLGWPQETADLRYFYPTDVLVTDRGIIFLWVCRMIMFGLEFMDEVPFSDVYIHPTVLTMDGRRMSKSLGTGIDPLEMADGRGYGSDAVRFALVSRASQTQQDMRFGEKMIEDVRNFNTKIWNATRFVLLNLDGFDRGQPVAETALELPERWICSRYARLVGDVTTHLQTYEFDRAAGALYDFLWREFCDWYVEMAKVDLTETRKRGNAETRPERRHAVQYTLWYILSNTMKLLHPIMPFVTEEVWQALPHDGASIMIAPWPARPPRWIDDAAETQMALAMEAIRGIRSLRADLQVPPAQVIPADLRAADAERNTLARAGRYIETLARVAPLAFRSHADPRAAHGIVAALGRFDVFVPLEGVVDVPKQRARLQRVLAGLETDLGRLQQRLANREFLDRAPAEVVGQQRQRADDLRTQQRRLRDLLAGLSAG